MRHTQTFLLEKSFTKRKSIGKTTIKRVNFFVILGL